jgi:hypothetical protein
MRNAKKLIEEKKAQLGLTTTALASTAKSDQKQQIQEDKKAALIALKAKIAATTANSQIQNILGSSQAALQEQLVQRQQSVAERDRSLNLIIDSEGRTIDKRTGEVVQLQSRVPTLKANLKVQKRDYKTAFGDKKADTSGIASTLAGIESVIQESNQVKPTSTLATEDVSEFFDPRLKLAIIFTQN